MKVFIKKTVKDVSASDEYNIINYGLGGQIELHVDYWSRENKRRGGDNCDQVLIIYFISRRSQNINIPGILI